MMEPHFKLHVAGENALMIYFSADKNSTPGIQSSANVSKLVQQADLQLRDNLGQLLIDTVPSYASLLVIFDAFAIDHYQIRQLLRKQLDTLKTGELGSKRVIELPVFYDLSTGPDLKLIAEKAQCSVQDVIDLHCQHEYQVYAIGFAPGFAYLGEVDERIAMPRIATPRELVHKGSVAIADRQTAVYPADSPGGWNIIGRCPIDMFDAESTPHMPVNTGDTVKFVAIDKPEFLALGGQL